MFLFGVVGAATAAAVVIEWNGWNGRGTTPRFVLAAAPDERLLSACTTGREVGTKEGATDDERGRQQATFYFLFFEIRERFCDMYSSHLFARVDDVSWEKKDELCTSATKTKIRMTAAVCEKKGSCLCRDETHVNSRYP